jgi:sugar lactone lactonase YvrE
MRQAWRGIAGLLAAGALTTGGSIALADNGGGGRHGGRDRGAAATTTFTMPATDGPPEGIAFDKRSGRFFVSRTGTGAIFSGAFGTKELSSFIPGGTSTGAPLATGLKVRKGLLYIAGASTGKITVVNLATKAVVATFDTRTVNDQAQPTFINDLAVTESGDIFATDSKQPFVYRIDGAAVRAGGGPIRAINVAPEIKIDTAPDAFNLNGIVARSDGDELIVVQSNTGKLFRITFGDRRGRDDRRAAAAQATGRRIEEIQVQGGPLTGGDGLLQDRGRLLVVRGSTKDHRNGAIDVVKLRRHRTRGRVESEFSDPSFAGPSTIARTGKRLLVVNANFANATKVTEFTVSAIARNAIRHGGGGGGGRNGRG